MNKNYLALIFGAFAVFMHVASPPAAAGDDLMRTPRGQVSGSNSPNPADIRIIRSVLDLPDVSGSELILERVDTQDRLVTRGAKEAQLYRLISPSVVLVATDKGLGSGSVIAPGSILTNWHVIAGASKIFAIFKPEQEGHEITAADAVPVRISKVDEVADLAMLNYAAAAKSVKPIELGSDTEIEVGADVHAIGHPTGEAWTYTRGVISQFRRNFKWNTDRNTEHQADVIQTQTPINPGNSGGPLLSNAGHMIGVNAFKATGEGLNFAISVDDVRKFIAAPGRGMVSGRPSPKKADCEPQMLYDGRSEDNKSNIRALDAFCTGKVGILLVVPDDKERSIRLLIDLNADEKADIWVYDWDRDGKWDYSLHASKYDGKIDMIGYHPDGELEPTRYERYKGQPTPWAN